MTGPRTNTVNHMGFNSDQPFRSGAPDEVIRQGINQMSREMDGAKRLEVALDAIYDVVSGMINEAPPSQRTKVRELVTFALRAMARYFEDQGVRMGISRGDMDTSMAAADKFAMAMTPMKEMKEGQIEAVDKPQSPLIGLDGKPLTS